MPKKKISPEMHYALSCKSVDDRTLNRYVFGLLAREIVRRPVKAPTLRILDTQGQSGVMLSRLLEWQLFERARYTQLTENQPHDEILDWWRTWSKTWSADLTQKKKTSTCSSTASDEHASGCAPKIYRLSSSISARCVTT